MTIENIKKLKRGVVTVEAAVLVPLVALIMTMLIGYVYYMHESVWSKSAAYEAVLYALQITQDGGSYEDRAVERINERYSQSVFNFAESSAEVSGNAFGLSVKWKYGVLNDVFGELFTVENEINVLKIDPVAAKHIEWAAGKLLD